MSLSRRGFLLSLLGLSALAGGGLALHNQRRAASDPELFLADLLRRRLPHLELEDGLLARFAREHLARAGDFERTRVARLAAAPGELWSRLWPLRRGAVEMSPERRLYERELMARFLLSTDYFRRGEGAGAVVRWVAYPDPYELGCANPLAVRTAARS